jgi:WD repeat-containing protein 19
MVIMTQETVVSVPYLVQVSVLVGRKTLFLYNLHDPDNPVELAFQQRYGSVVTYKWYVYYVQTLSV